MSTKFSWEIRPTDGDVDFGEEWNNELPLLVRRLLTQRGISGLNDVQQYLHPRLADLGDPFALKEMEQAVQRIFQAIDNNEQVCIYGDYDVDGVSSVTLLYLLLKAYGLEPSYFIPTRTKEGYGLSEEGIAHALSLSTRPVSLLISVDCGTSSHKEVAMLQQRGVDVLILDHHEASEQGRPPALAIVNAKMHEQEELTCLCSAGVVFKLAHALLKRRRLAQFDLRDYLDIVAIATIADIVPLVGENRLLTRHGLRVMERKGNLGLQALNEVVGLKSRLSTSHVSFRLGPRLNAAGRMDEPMDALALLMSTDREQARALARRLDEHNQARQQEEHKIREEAAAMIEAQFDLKKDQVIVVGSRRWHPGVVGIVASLLMRRYHKPTFVISFDKNGLGKGSGRSIPGISLVDAIHACRDELISGGGHDMAAGLVIDESQIDGFRQAFDRYVRENASKEQLKPVLLVDAEVEFSELSLELLDSYELLEPFGNANPQPVFMSRGIMLDRAPQMLAGNHMRLSLRQGYQLQDAMYFNVGNIELPPAPWDVAFTIDRNIWRGRTSLTMSIQDIRTAQ